MNAKDYLEKVASALDLAGAAVGGVAGAGAGYASINKKDSVGKKIRKVVGGALLGGAAGHGVHHGGKSIYNKMKKPVAAVADDADDTINGKTKQEAEDKLVDIVKGMGLKEKGKSARSYAENMAEVNREALEKMEKPKRKPNLPGSNKTIDAVVVK